MKQKFLTSSFSKRYKMRNHDIDMILRGLYQGLNGKYDKEEVIRAILWAYDLGFTDGRQ